jgi:hypothetical protein
MSAQRLELSCGVFGFPERSEPLNLIAVSSNELFCNRGGGRDATPTLASLILFVFDLDWPHFARYTPSRCAAVDPLQARGLSGQPKQRDHRSKSCPPLFSSPQTTALASSSIASLRDAARSEH